MCAENYDEITVSAFMFNLKYHAYLNAQELSPDLCQIRNFVKLPSDYVLLEFALGLWLCIRPRGCALSCWYSIECERLSYEFNMVLDLWPENTRSFHCMTDNHGNRQQLLSLLKKEQT